MPQYQGVWTLEQQAQAQSNQQWVTDPNFKNTTLLLQADGTGSGSQNQTFLDGSANNFFISTNVGNPPQGTFSPFSQAPGYWGNYLNGSSSLITPTSSATPLAIGSGDFTIEFWVNSAIPGSDVGILENRAADGSSTGLGVGIGSSTGKIRLYSNVELFNAGVITANQFTHVAIVRSSSTGTVYINGISAGTISSWSTNFTDQGFKIGIGAGGNAMTGYISNFRFVKGTAVYTANFTPTTAPLTAITNTSLLTCQSNRFVDNSTNGYAITVNGGTPSVQAFGPFAPALQWTPDVVGGSSYFAGANYLKTPSSSAFALGTGQFCIEAWHYPNNTNGGQILSTRTSGINQASSFSLMQYGSSSYSMYANNNHVLTAMTSFQWNHVIVTRDASNTLRLILNGVLGNYEASYVENITETILSIGALNNGGEVMYGYTTGHRITKGSIPTTYQTSSTTIGATIYTPPTQPVTLTSQGATSANVSYLSNYTNAGIYDGKMANNLETVGNAQVATSPVKYGTGSIAFDGTGDRLQVSPNTSQNLVLGTGDFTIELWVLFRALPAGDLSLVGGDTNAAYLIATSTGQIRFGTYNVNWLIGPGGTMATNVWNHIAVTRANSIINLFLNGVAVVAPVVSAQNFSAASYVIGGDQVGGVTSLNGFMDDIRITKACRYFTTFTPPQQALPRQ